MFGTSPLPNKYKFVSYTPSQAYPDYQVSIGDIPGHLSLYNAYPECDGLNLAVVAAQNIANPPPFYIDIAASECCLGGPDLVIYAPFWRRGEAAAVIADWLRRYCGPARVKVTDEGGDTNLPYVPNGALPPEAARAADTFQFHPAPSLAKALNDAPLHEHIRWEVACPYGSRIKGFVNSVEVVRLTKACAAINEWIIDIPTFPVFIGRLSDRSAVTAQGFVDGVHHALVYAQHMTKLQVEWLNALCLPV